MIAMKQVYDVKSFVQKENKKVSMWFVSFAIFFLLYLRAIVSANLAILKDYRGQSLDSLPWYTYTHIFMRHGEQSYTSASWSLAIILSILVAFTAYKLLRALFIRSIYTEKLNKTIGYTALVVKGVVNPLMIFGTIYSGYVSAKLLDMQFKHIIFSVIGVIDYLGNFAGFIIVIALFILVRVLSKQEINFQQSLNRNKHRMERQEEDKLHEIRNIRRGM